MCKVLGVARSGYYARQAGHGTGPSGQRPRRHSSTGYARSTGRAGAPTGFRGRRRNCGPRGRVVNRKRIARLIREHGIAGRHLHKRRRTTVQDRNTPSAPDLIGRDFTAAGPDVRWVGDITYLPVGGSWMYLATVIDLHSRHLVWWSLADHMHARLVADALEAAVAARGSRVDGVIFHSDRASQYGSADFASLCRRHGGCRTTSPGRESRAIRCSVPTGAGVSEFGPVGRNFLVCGRERDLDSAAGSSPRTAWWSTPPSRGSSSVTAMR
ncbi:DDE-type integrase/transposase/recombinase [Kitasatospora sp. NPDC085895]|uniref:DDE-type integrase/transposase/recombinase n=1 Tax=Kitasatospora sp. NPDC085895 TaxID=3155057 RepID=UPI00344FCBFA